MQHSWLIQVKRLHRINCKSLVSYKLRVREHRITYSHQITYSITTFKQLILSPSLFIVVRLLSPLLIKFCSGFFSFTLTHLFITT